ncbi:unnamed protein product [Mesocestoides corti]|uniref:CUB domain-containing protein n=1 Tax=Mesocestoides corti TaxID=53468 RepID=A0A0R3UR35_MESCO|nr:unnamed protein product [Mesocestoides corti]
MVSPTYLLFCLAVCAFGRVVVNTDTENAAEETTIAITSRVIQGVTSKIQRCLSNRICRPALKSFHVIGSNSVNWQGRILSSTPQSPYYSCELSTSSIALSLTECTALNETHHEFQPLEPIHMSNFVVKFDVEEIMTGRFHIGNSRPYTEIVSFPTNDRYTNSGSILNLLASFINQYC